MPVARTFEQENEGIRRESKGGMKKPQV